MWTLPVTVIVWCVTMWRNFSRLGQFYSWLSFSFDPQEFETGKKMSEGMGAAATRENDQGPLRQVTGWQQWAEDGVHVQAQLLQDGLCLQVRGLYVQTHSTHTGSSGESSSSGYIRELILSKRVTSFSAWRIKAEEGLPYCNIGHSIVFTSQ